jgi:hypothetical protein
MIILDGSNGYENLPVLHAPNVKQITPYGKIIYRQLWFFPTPGSARSHSCCCGGSRQAAWVDAFKFSPAVLLIFGGTL